MKYLPDFELCRRMAATLHGKGVESLFVAFDAERQIQLILRESSTCNLMRVSDFCREDSTISLDAFQNALATRGERTLILGIGEYGHLVDDWRPLNLLWEMRRSGRKFIAPVFDGYKELEEKRNHTAFRPLADPVVFLEPTRKLWSYQNFAVLGQVECKGLKAILQRLETGYSGVLAIKTKIKLQMDRGTTIDTYGALYVTMHPKENVSPAMLAEEQWQKLVEEPENLDASFFGIANYLRLNREQTDNPYLREVLAKTKNHAQFRGNFIKLILDYKPEDPEFPELSAGRNKLANKLEEEDIQSYLFQLGNLPQLERVRYLSPKRKEEKLEILKCVSSEPELAGICGIENLGAYMDDYQIAAVNEEISELLTSYFQSYKKAKLGNCAKILPAPQNGPQIINSLPTRNALVEKLQDPQVKLYWIDGLGCEYLGFLQHYAQKNHLTMKAQVGRVKLPSKTGLNKDFFEDWPYESEAVRELDNIKHGHDLHLDPDECKEWPLHLIQELELLENLMARIARELKTKKYKKIVVAADHGATRMAVIAKDDLVWEMPEKGRYSGRCCPAADFIRADLPANIMQVDDGKWLVVTDYARFRGSRMASVEVHGGATLEEAIVPVLEFSTGKILPEIRLITEPDIRLGPGQNTVTLELASTLPIDKSSLHLEDKIYPLTQSGEKRYTAEIPVANLQNSNEGVIYLGNDKLASTLRFKVSRGVKSNDSFNDFFE